jgi:HEAT repeat protein
MDDIYNYSPLIQCSLSILEAGIHHPQWMIRFAAAEAMADLQDDRGIQDLLEGLQQKDASLRDRAIQALGKLKKESLSSCFLQALDDCDALIRGHALESLVCIQNIGALEKILHCLCDKNHFVQECAVASLTRLPQECAVPLLESVMSDGGKYNCRYRIRLLAAYYLMGDENEKGREFLYNMLRCPDRWIAFLAAQRLADLGDKEGVPQLQNMLEKGEWAEKIAAMEGLIKLGIEQEVVNKIYRPVQEIGELARLEVIRLLDRFYPEKTKTLLHQAFQTKNENIKIRILEIMGDLKRPDLVDIGQEILDNGPEHLRAYLLMSIEKIHDPALLPRLSPMLEKSHFLVRLQTARVILLRFSRG